MADCGTDDAGLPDSPKSPPRAEAGSSHQHLDVRAMPSDPERRSRDDHEPTAAGSASFDDLPPEILKPILGFLDCIQLLEASKVCQRWNYAAEEILEDITQRRTRMRCRAGWNIATCRNMFKGVSKPASNVHLQLKVLHYPNMAGLQLPDRQHPLLDLSIVADTCQRLWKVDLRGFVIDTGSLGKLAQQNRRQLENVTLPAGYSDEQLETLLGPLQKLLKLTVDSPHGTGRWLPLLPKTLRDLDISGLEAPLERWRPQADLSRLKKLCLRGCSGVTDWTLACLLGLEPSLNELLIADCPEVTAGGLLFLGRTNLRELTLHGLPAGDITDAAQDSPEDTGQWLEKLPQSLRTLDIIDCPEVTAGGLLHLGRLTNLKKLTLHGLSAGDITDAAQDSPEDTGQWLEKLPQSLKTLDISDCPEVTAGGLLHLGRLTYLTELTLHGLLAGDITDAAQDSPEDTGQWLEKLPQSLWSLDISDCPSVTAGGLRHVGRLTALNNLNLHGLPAGVITDDVLDSLHCCYHLQKLQLAHRPAITAVAVKRHVLRR